MIPSLPLYILTCFNDTKLDELEIGEQLIDLNDSLNASFLSTIVLTTNDVRDKISLRRQIILDKRYNMIYREKLDESTKSKMSAGDYFQLIVGKEYTKTGHFFVDDVVDIYQDPDYESVFSYIDNLIKTTFCGKITNKKLELIKTGICGFAFHVACIMIREARFSVKYPLKQKGDTIPVVYWPFVINQHDENPILEKVNTGLFMLYKHVQNPRKFSGLLMELIEVILPIYLNGSFTQDTEIGLHPLDTNVSIDLGILALGHTDIQGIKNEFKNRIESEEN